LKPIFEFGNPEESRPIGHFDQRTERSASEP
jgi:hypothetical protein